MNELNLRQLGIPEWKTILSSIALLKQILHLTKEEEFVNSNSWPPEMLLNFPGNSNLFGCCKCLSCARN